MAQRYWDRFTDDGAEGRNGELPPGEDLAALRTGLGRDALTVPKMWPFYTITPERSSDLELFRDVSAGQQAEHVALALFGVHQQSQRALMHVAGIGLGTALRALRGHGKYSADAVDRRVSAMVTSTSVPTLAYRMRGLVIQLRDIKQPLDYNRLVRDLERWCWPDQRPRVRKGWAQGYQRWDTRSESTAG